MKHLITVVAGIAACALVTPCAEAVPPRGPMAFQAEGERACDDGYYCMYAAEDLNTGPGAKQVWMYNGEWKHFRTDPLTGQGYTPDATDRVFSVVNKTRRSIHFMEWDFGAPGSVCITVPPLRVVRAVKKYGSDGGYGSVSFDDRLAQQHKCVTADDGRQAVTAAHR